MFGIICAVTDTQYITHVQHICDLCVDAQIMGEDDAKGYAFTAARTLLEGDDDARREVLEGMASIGIRLTYQCDNRDCE